jgi:hypothetical protein
MLRRKRVYANHPEQLPAKKFVARVSYAVMLSIDGEPPSILTAILKRKLATGWQRRYVQMRIDRWRERWTALVAARTDSEAQR